MSTARAVARVVQTTESVVGKPIPGALCGVLSRMRRASRGDRELKLPGAFAEYLGVPTHGDFPWERDERRGRSHRRLRGSARGGKVRSVVVSCAVDSGDRWRHSIGWSRGREDRWPTRRSTRGLRRGAGSVALALGASGASSAGDTTLRSPALPDDPLRERNASAVAEIATVPSS